MPGRLARRSGYAVFTTMELLGWRPDVVIQVGVGLHHEEVQVMVEEWPGVKLHGFEPHPDIVDELRKNYPGRLIGFAIGAESRLVDLYSKVNHKDGSSLFPLESHKVKKIEVTQTTLDHALLGVPSPDEVSLTWRNRNTLLWLDCEGSELNALKGAERFLEFVDVVNLEMTSDPPAPGWCDMMETHRWLVERGYRRQSSHSHRSSAGQADAIYCRSHLWQAKYCSCPISFLEAENDVKRAANET